METLFLSALDPQCAETAANIIRRGGLVAIPTETVYGLGANGLDETAVAKIFEAKGRPQDNPLILHIAGAEQIEQFAHHIPQAAYDLAEKFWPGPLTIILPARDLIPRRTTGGLDTVGLRCPDCHITREIIRLSGVPIAAPSANISGKPSTTTAEHVLFSIKMIFRWDCLSELISYGIVPSGLFPIRIVPLRNRPISFFSESFPFGIVSDFETTIQQ